MVRVIIMNIINIFSVFIFMVPVIIRMVIIIIITMMMAIIIIVAIIITIMSDWLSWKENMYLV